MILMAGQKITADEALAEKRDALLARLRDVCDEKRYDAASIAADWQESHGHSIKTTSDLTGIEALITDLEAKDAA